MRLLPHAVYGVDLTTLVKLEGGLVPNILSECIKEVESSSLTSTGIYRVSGHNTEILELKDKYDHGRCVCAHACVHVCVCINLQSYYIIYRHLYLCLFYILKPGWHSRWGSWFLPIHWWEHCDWCYQVVSTRATHTSHHFWHLQEHFKGNWLVSPIVYVCGGTLTILLLYREGFVVLAIKQLGLCIINPLRSGFSFPGVIVTCIH